MNEPPPSIQLQINGEPHVVPAGQPLAELITSLGLPPQATLVEHNGRALLRDEWRGLTLSNGDGLEILRIVAGG